MTPLTRAVEQGACIAAEFLFEDGKQFSKRKRYVINHASILQSVNKTIVMTIFGFSTVILRGTKALAFKWLANV